MLRIVIGVVLLVWGVLWLGFTLADALIGDADPDVHRVPGWAIKPSLYALVLIGAGVITLID